MERLFGEHVFGVQVFDHSDQCIEHMFDVKSTGTRRLISGKNAP